MSAPASTLDLVRATADRLADSYAAILATGEARPVGPRRGFVLWGPGPQRGLDGAVMLTPDAIVLVDNPVTKAPALQVTWSEAGDLLRAHVHSGDRAAIVAAYDEYVRLERAHRTAAERVRALVAAGVHPEHGHEVAINGIPAEPTHIAAALSVLAGRPSVDVPARDLGSEVDGGTYCVETRPGGMRQARELAAAANSVLVLYRRGVLRPLVVGALAGAATAHL